MIMWSKLPRRRIRSILAFGEGPTDEAFLRHVRNLYCLRGCYKVVDVDNARGGGADGAAEKALRIYKGSEHTSKLILLDGDTTLSRVWRTELIACNWDIVIPTPCIEGLLLDILYPSRSHDTWSTDRCKDEFHVHCLSEKAKTDYRSYSAKFTKNVIDRESKRIETLKKIMKILLS